MLVHQTVFDGVWSPNISRLSRPLVSFSFIPKWKSGEPAEQALDKAGRSRGQSERRKNPPAATWLFMLYRPLEMIDMNEWGQNNSIYWVALENVSSN